MAKTALTGTRIRARRIDSGIRQADLARRCEISPSYLNLIEHNRRRIGGALLNRLARALEVESSSLSEGAEVALTAALGAAAAHTGTNAEIGRVEEFAGRFPGWARLAERQFREIERLERVVEVLNDRLTYDPHLAASMHDVLSTVTAIRSTSAILADGEAIEPEWQARFHRNLYEDSQRLAQSAGALVDYLDSAGDSEQGASLPLEELEAWLAAQNWGLAALEEDPDRDLSALIADAPALASSSARDLAMRHLERYRADARALPLDTLVEAVQRIGPDPVLLASACAVDLPVIFRRLAALPEDAFPDRQMPGLVICDGSGTLTFRKPIAGFDLPRYGAACAIWPLFQALQRPMMPVRASVTMAGRDRRRFLTNAISLTSYPAGFNGPPVVEALMLIQPDMEHAASANDLTIGTSCRICVEPTCPARREPSILTLADAPV